MSTRPPRALPSNLVPSLLGLPELRALTGRVAAEVLAGRHEVHIDPDRRWFRQLSGDGYVDVWLISWAREQAAELHDHAGSLGALTVVSGELTEQYWSPRRSGPLPEPRPWRRRPGLSTRRLVTGRSVGFAAGHVHDVVNEHAEPAVSVHAYSPPLTAMSYYEVRPDGRLLRTRSELAGGDAGRVSPESTT